MITIDYQNSLWKIMKRKNNIEIPFYRYGAEYELLESGIIEIPTIDTFIENWTKGTIDLPGLDTALLSHTLIENILTSGGIKPPYSFT